jgi:AraC-like DNA-binding protein
MVVGVWTRSISLFAPERFDTIGVRLRPGAASALWDEPLQAFSNTVVDATAVWGRAASSLREELCDAPDTPTRIAILERFLIRRMRRTAPALAGPLARIRASRGRASIDDVASTAGVSHRQLERAFRTHIGVSPKAFSRIVRFQHVLRSAPQTPRAWADVAIAYGYADQSHLIRDFTQFAGETPTMLLESQAAVANYFRRR